MSANGQDLDERLKRHLLLTAELIEAARLGDAWRLRTVAAAWGSGAGEIASLICKGAAGVSRDC